MFFLFIVFDEGSSPRVRGKRLRTWSFALAPRLIPACAGKTGIYAAVAKEARAHPRVCGENCGYPAFSVFGLGSSPRVRGKPTTSISGDGGQGLIPACAGKTLNDLEF